MSSTLGAQILIHLIFIYSILLAPWKCFIPLWGPARVLSCIYSVFARRGRRAILNAGLMFNATIATQHPNETGHWFAFRESHLAEFGWVTEEGRLLQFKAEIYVWPDNPNSIDSSSQHDLYQSSEILLWAHRAEGTSPSHNSKLHTTHFLSS